MNCPKCGSKNLMKNGLAPCNGKQKYKCRDCGTETVNPINGKPNEPIISQKKRGISIEELVRANDVEELINEALKKLEKGTLFTEQEFVEIAGIKGKPYRTILDGIEIKRYSGRISDVRYYGVPEDIEYLKNERYIMR